MQDPYIIYGALFAAGAVVITSILLYFDRRKHPDKKPET
jgi:ABC-type cobalamin transport system permease subunit